MIEVQKQVISYVVKHTQMPATLLEVAFVSNPKEEAILKSDVV